MNRRLPLVTSSMERLTRLIEKAEPILQAALPADEFSAKGESRMKEIHDEKPRAKHYATCEPS